MTQRKSIFFRMILVVMILLLPILLLYSYTNKTSLKVINDEIVDNNQNQLLFLKNQIDTIVNRFTFLPSMLSRDSSVLYFQKSVLTKDYYAMTQYKPILEEKLYLQSFAGGWKNDLAVYLPDVQMRIATDENEAYNSVHLERVSLGQWQYHKASGDADDYFDFYFTQPWKTDLSRVNAIFETKIYGSGIRTMLENYKGESNRDPFLLTETGDVIAGDTGKLPLIRDVTRELDMTALGEQGHTNLKINGNEYFASYVFIPELKMYLIDYLPLETVISPILKSRNLFYAFTALLVMASLFALLLLYRYVQVPIATLVRGLKAVEIGDFSYKISRKFNNEFDFLSFRFNEMTAQISHLIENVYEEQNRSRLSALKQLQSQINPHFLYNCLSFIAGSAKIGMNQTAMNMAYNLADYYRYSTRVENQTPVLREEIGLLNTYLEIYKMRLERIDYTIDIPEELMDLKIPRLILQPIVENAIEHGLEPKMGQGKVTITGYMRSGECEIVVEDEGVGLSDEALETLKQKISNKSLEDQIGCGLWNVNQRLKYRFGPKAGLTLSRSSSTSGLCVMVRWSYEEEEAKDHETIAIGG